MPSQGAGTLSAIAGLGRTAYRLVRCPDPVDAPLYASLPMAETQLLHTSAEEDYARLSVYAIDRQDAPRLGAGDAFEYVRLLAEHVSYRSQP